MSSKKKVHKEKEDVKSIKCATFVLESDKAAVPRSNDYPLSSDVTNILYGRPYGALNCSDWLASEEWMDVVPPSSIAGELEKFAHKNLRRRNDQSLPKFSLSFQQHFTEGSQQLGKFAMANWTRRQLQRQWGKKVLACMPSLVQCPRHWVFFSYSPCSTFSDANAPPRSHCVHESSHSAFALAEVISRIVSTHTEWNNIAFLNADSAGLSERQHQRSMAISYASSLESQNLASTGYEPVMDVRKLVGLSIRNLNSLSSAGANEVPVIMKEKRDVSFQLMASRKGEDGIEEEENVEDNTLLSDGRRKELPENSETEKFIFVNHHNSTHVNVCVGKYFYLLPVLDPEKRTLKSLSALSAALDLIYNDAKDRESAFLHLNVSDEVREELREFYSLLSRVSATPNGAREDIYRRLCEVSEVNASNLSLLDGALFTIVINGPLKLSERANEAQWLHNVFSLYFQWDRPDEFYATAVSLLSLDTMLLFFKKALAGSFSGGRGVSDGTSAIHRHGLRAGSTGCSTENLSGDVGRGSSRSSANIMDAPSITAVGVEGDDDKSQKDPTVSRNVGRKFLNHVCLPGKEKDFRPLDLWLPGKHRIALRPYAPICSLSHTWYLPSTWIPHNSDSRFSFSNSSQNCLSFSQFCALVILAVERVTCTDALRGDGEKIVQRPSVSFAYHHPECTYPSVVSLMTDEVVEWIQAVRSPSALITSEVRQTTRQHAILSVTQRLQNCIECPISFYGLSRSAYEWEENEEPTDVCITSAFLTNRYQRHCGPFKVLSAGSDFCIPSRMIITGMAVQKHLEKRVIFGSGIARPGELGVAPAEDAFAKAFILAFSTELSTF